MAVLASWSGGALPTVVGDVTVATGTEFWGSDALVLGETAAAAYARFDVSAAAVAFRMYFRTPTAWASAATTIMGLRPSGSVVALGLQFAGTAAAGQARVTRTGGANVGTSPNGTLALDTIYRWEVLYDSSTGYGAWAIFELGATVPLWEGSASGVTEWQVPLIRVDVGRINNTPSLPAWRLAHLVIDDDASAFVGRAAGDTATGPAPSPDDFPILFDGTNFTGLAPTLVGEGVGSHGAERLQVVSPDVGLWPTQASLQVNQGDQTAYAQYAIPEAQPVLHIVTWMQLPLELAPESWAAVTLRANLLEVVAAVTISGSQQPGQIRLTATGGSNLASTASNTLDVGGLYRIELLYDAAQSRARLGLFLPQSHLQSWDSGWIVDPALAAEINFIQFGRVTFTPVVGVFKYARWWVDAALPAGQWHGYDQAVEGLPLDELWDGEQLLPIDPVAQLWDGTTLQPLS